MRTIKYWLIPILDDSPAYSIREKTRKAALAELATRGDTSRYGKPKKVVVKYSDIHSLLFKALGEGSISYEEGY